MSTKMTKRELQSPDKFTTTTASWLDWATKHPRETTIAGVVVAALLVAVGLIASGGPSTDPKAGAALSAALELVDRKVEKPGAAAAEDEKKEPTFASEQEKQEAIVKAMQAVRDEHRGTSSALTATLAQADAFLALGKSDEAIARYEEYLSAAPKSGSLRFLAHEGKAAALQAKGDVDGAIAALEAMAAELPGYKDRAQLGKGRIHEAKGEWEKAREAYQSVKTDFPDGASNRAATERLSQLDLRHPAEAPADAK
ncbi:MAG TPA: tetratricopeptide repeat protein [Vulgatibacter sp.]